MRDWLVAIRLSKGMTQAAVAEKAMISQPSLCAIERGESTPKTDTAMRLASVLGFAWTEFYERKAHDERNPQS